MKHISFSTDVTIYDFKLDCENTIWNEVSWRIWGLRRPKIQTIIDMTHTFVSKTSLIKILKNDPDSNQI